MSDEYTEKALADDTWNPFQKEHHIFGPWGHPRDHYRLFGFDRPKVWVTADNRSYETKNKFGFEDSREEWEPDYHPYYGWRWEQKSFVDMHRKLRKRFLDNAGQPTSQATNTKE